MDTAIRSHHKFGMFLTLILFIMLTLCYDVQGQCTGLTVYNGGSEVDASSVCLMKYKTKDCIDFFKTFDQSKLPDAFPKSDTSRSVERPSWINLNGLDTPDGGGVIYPGITISWRPPSSGISKEFCYGYLVVWYIEDPNDAKCQLFHVKSGNSSINYELRYDVNVVHNSSDYTVRVYSMPPYGPEKKNDVSTYVQAQIKTNDFYYEGQPGYWSPSVSYQANSYGEISSSFSLPPANFNITRFRVYLMSDNDVHIPLVAENHTAEIRTNLIAQHFMYFTVTESGFYKIVVWADDDYHMQTDKCRCWVIESSNGQRRCMNVCGSTETNYFYVNITEVRIPVPTTTSMTSSTPTLAMQTTVTLESTTGSNSSIPEELPGSDVPAAIIGGIVSACLLVIFIIFGICLIRNKEKVKLFILESFCPSPNLPASKQQTEDLEKQGIKPGLDKLSYPQAVPRLSKKTVYIMSADDHEAHVELVESFVAFLKAHCQCNVILPSDSDQRDTSAYEWFLNSVNRSDYIIFINSEGAEKLIEAYLNRNSYKNRIVGPDGDLFIFGLKHILVSEEVRERTVALVSFHGNHCKKYLQIPTIYMLPKHLPQLLQKIHRLDTVKTYDSCLPMNVQNISNLFEGAKLLSAIKNVKIYEEDNPKWFENTFGDLKTVKPVYERCLSNDSAYPPSLPYDRLDSVSLQFSCTESPTSDPQTLPYSMPIAHSHIQSGDDSKINKVADVSGTSGNETQPLNPLFNLDDGFSCVTVAEVSDRNIKKAVQQHWQFDGHSIIPPETVSDLTSYSAALSEINRKNIVPQRLMEKAIHHQPRLNIDDDFIIPPESTSQIVFDSYSTAMSEINRNTEELFSQHFEPTSSSRNTNQQLQPAGKNINIDQYSVNNIYTDQHFQPAAGNINNDQHFQPAANTKKTDQHMSISNNINNNHNCQDIEEDDSPQITIIPPDNPVDIHIDNVSLAFADINANSYNMLLQTTTNFLMLHENDNLKLEFDSVSI